MKKLKNALITLIVVVGLSFGLTPASLEGSCFTGDLECIAGWVLPFDQYDPAKESKKEWSAIRGYIYGYDNVIDFVFMLDDESMQTLSQGLFGLEVEVIEKGGHQLVLKNVSHNLPPSSNSIIDTNVSDFGDNYVNAVLIRNPENLQKDKWYKLSFTFHNNIPISGINIQPNLVIDLDVDSFASCVLFPFRCLDQVIDPTDSSEFKDKFTYFGLETDYYLEFKAYPNGSQGVYWNQSHSKAGSVLCKTKSCLTSAIENLINEAPTNNELPGFFVFSDHKPVKFTGSSTVYLVSNNSLWPILNEQTYSLLGFRDDCSLTPDWSEVIEFSSFMKVFYEDRIKKTVLPSQNNPSINRYIAYRVVEKVGPVSCVSMDIDPAKIYLFGDDEKFHHIQNEQVYYGLGYNPDWSDVVKISPDLFMYYGEGDEIADASVYLAGYDDDEIEPPDSPDYTFNRSTVCKDVQQGDPWNPIDETLIFYNTDDYVYSWIQLDDVYSPLNILWKWYGLDGFESEYETTTSSPEEGYYYPWYRTSCSKHVTNIKKYGQWHVDIYVDGQKVASDYFVLTLDLRPPTGLIAEAISKTEVDLNWEAVSGADGYKVYRDDALIITTPNKFYLDVSLVNDTQYCYKVKAYYGNMSSEYSSQFCAVTDSDFIYVPDDYSNIQEAIDAFSDESEIIVRDGTYYESNITFPNRAIIVRSENGPEHTIISGDSANCVVKFYNSGENCLLDGFTITNGGGYQGGGIYCYNSSPTIINCSIRDNKAYYGGGIYNYESSPVIANCFITGNYGYYYGGGIYDYLSFPIITNCFITGNQGYYYGGGIYDYKSSITMTNCTVSGNLTKYYGGGIHLYRDEGLLVENSIIWGNENRYGPDQIYAYQSHPVVIGSSDIEGGYYGLGNIDTDPLFVNPISVNNAPTSDGDYHLSIDSLCIDAGNSTKAVNDIDGDIRPQDGNGDGTAESDMGADEAIERDAIAPYLFSDDFDDGIMDSVWSYLRNRAVEEGGIMKVETAQTDQGGELLFEYLDVGAIETLKLRRKVKVHYANNYSFTLLRIQFEGHPFFGVAYYNYSYSGGDESPLYGIHLFKNSAWLPNRLQWQDDVSEGIDCVWDAWFDEEIHYNLKSGILSYYINDELTLTYNVGAIPVSENQRVKITVQSAGWWTGHYQYMDDLVIEGE